MCPRGRGDQEIHRREVLAATYTVRADEAVVLSAEIVEMDAGMSNQETAHICFRS